MRQQHDVLTTKQAGVHDGLAFVDVEPRPGEAPPRERVDQRGTWNGNS